MWCVQSGESLGSVASLLERQARAVDLPSPTALSSLTAQLPQVDLGALGAGLGGVGEQVGVLNCACKWFFFLRPLFLYCGCGDWLQVAALYASAAQALGKSSFGEQLAAAFDDFVMSIKAAFS